MPVRRLSMTQPSVVWAADSGTNQDRLSQHLAGTPVALLAGFALSAALVVVSQRPSTEDEIPLTPSGAAAVLLGASGLFLAALVYAGRASAWARTPDEV